MTQSLETLIAICLTLAGRSDEAPRVLGSGAAGDLSVKPAPERNPYWLLQAGRRDEAVRVWETALRHNPSDLRIWHELAVAHYWQARAQEDRGENAVSEWKISLGYWAGVLACDDYWWAWAEERATPCGILPEDRASVRDEFLTYIRSPNVREPERVRSYLDAVSSVRREMRANLQTHLLSQSSAESKNGTRYYEELLIQLNHEWAAAYRIDRLKMAEKIAHRTNQQGLPPNLESTLSGIDWESKPDIQTILNTVCVVLDFRDSPHHEFPSCGPGMLEYLGMTAAVQAFVKRCQALRTGSNGMDGLLGNVSQDSLLLEFYLDPELGRLLIMIDLSMYNRCQAEVKERINKKPGGSLIKLQKLMCLACHNQAEEALAHRNYETAVEAVELAYLYCGAAFTNAQPFECDMPKLMTGICKGIAESVGRKELERQQACNFLKRLAQVAPPGRVPHLDRVLAEIC